MKYLHQAVILAAITFAAEIIKYLLPLPIPVSIYGLVLLFLLLKRGHSPEKLYVNRLAAQRVAGAAEQECQGPDTTEDGDEGSEDTTQKEKNEEGRGED